MTNEVGIGIKFNVVSDGSDVAVLKISVQYEKGEDSEIEVCMTLEQRKSLAMMLVCPNGAGISRDFGRKNREEMTPEAIDERDASIKRMATRAAENGVKKL